MKKQIIVVIITILIFILGLLIYIFIDNKKSDAIKFKEEYEILNNTVRESDGQFYNNVTIPKDNPIKIINTKEVLKILNSKKAIIYIGAGWCPWCRNAVPVLFEVAKKYNVKTIYYLNLDNEKSSYKIENGSLINTKKGTDTYYKLLDKLSDRLNDYKLTDEDGKKYDTKEKRIYIPYVIAIKDGKVVDDHVGTVSLDENQTKYDKMTTIQYQDLLNIYSSMFEKIN